MRIIRQTDNKVPKETNWFRRVYKPRSLLTNVTRNLNDFHLPQIVDSVLILVRLLCSSELKWSSVSIVFCCCLFFLFGYFFYLINLRYAGRRFQISTKSLLNRTKGCPRRVRADIFHNLVSGQLIFYRAQFLSNFDRQFVVCFLKELCYSSYLVRVRFTIKKK